MGQLNKLGIGWAEVRSPSIATDGLPSSAHPIALLAVASGEIQETTFAQWIREHSINRFAM